MSKGKLFQIQESLETLLQAVIQMQGVNSDEKKPFEVKKPGIYLLRNNEVYFVVSYDEEARQPVIGFLPSNLEHMSHTKEGKYFNFDDSGNDIVKCLDDTVFDKYLLPKGE